MRSSDRRCALALAALFALALPTRAEAEPNAEGFAVERFYPSAPGSRWLALDDLAFPETLGGAMAMTLGSSRGPLESGSLAVVSERAFARFGFAASTERLRFSFGFEMPVKVTGASGVAKGYRFTAPDIDLSSHPDTVADPRVGLDVRLLGSPGDAIRVGFGLALYLPNGARADYVTDDTVRAMGRWLFAGDVGPFAYAAHVGLHVRPRDDGAPLGPRGSELLFGAALGPRFELAPRLRASIGPEIYGTSALHGFFARPTTAVEGLLSGRFEYGVSDTLQISTKLGAGGGLHAEFGAPELRTVLTVEVAGSPFKP